MAIQRTLSIIKPDAVAKNVIGKIYSRFETNGLKIVAAQMRQLSQAEAEGFYAVHRERPFFADLVKFMTSGPVMIQVLEGEDAIAKNRQLMGATDPKKGAGNLAGLAIGLTLVLVHIVCIPITGTSVNPARSIGPALFEGGQALSQLWLFIVAPLVGAAISAIVWKAIGGGKD